MCEQCLVDAQFYVRNKTNGELSKEVLPHWSDPNKMGWMLFQAKQDGHLMKAGQWGLVRCNDPDFVWEVAPKEDPERDMSDEDLDIAYNTDSEFMDAADNFQQAVALFRHQAFNEKVDPLSTWQLVESARKAGYDPVKDGCFVYWLFSYLGKWITQHDPVSHQTI